MVFFTNKPMELITPEKGVSCKITGYTLPKLLELFFPESVIVDLMPNTRNAGAINTVISNKRLKYATAPIEVHTGNTIYVFQDAYRNVIKIEL